MALIHGLTTVGTAGTAVQATADTRRVMRLWAFRESGSSGRAYLSSAATAGMDIDTAAQLFEFLTPSKAGDPASTVRASDLYFDVSVSGEKVNWTMLVI